MWKDFYDLIQSGRSADSGQIYLFAWRKGIAYMRDKKNGLPAEEIEDIVSEGIMYFYEKVAQEKFYYQNEAMTYRFVMNGIDYMLSKRIRSKKTIVSDEHISGLIIMENDWLDEAIFEPINSFISLYSNEVTNPLALLRDRYQLRMKGRELALKHGLEEEDLENILSACLLRFKYYDSQEGDGISHSQLAAMIGLEGNNLAQTIGNLLKNAWNLLRMYILIHIHDESRELYINSLPCEVLKNIADNRPDLLTRYFSRDNFLRLQNCIDGKAKESGEQHFLIKFLKVSCKDKSAEKQILNLAWRYLETVASEQQQKLVLLKYGNEPNAKEEFQKYLHQSDSLLPGNTGTESRKLTNAQIGEELGLPFSKNLTQVVNNHLTALRNEIVKFIQDNNHS